MIASLRPRSYQKYLSLPIIGPSLDDFTTGLVIVASPWELCETSSRTRLIHAYFQQTGVQRLEELSQSSFEAAWVHYRHLRPDIARTIAKLSTYSKRMGILNPPKLSQRHL